MNSSGWAHQLIVVLRYGLNLISILRRRDQTRVEIKNTGTDKCCRRPALSGRVWDRRGTCSGISISIPDRSIRKRIRVIDLRLLALRVPSVPRTAALIELSVCLQPTVGGVKPMADRSWITAYIGLRISPVGHTGVIVELRVLPAFVVTNRALCLDVSC